jgi:hypothetical protein
MPRLLFSYFLLLVCAEDVVESDGPTDIQSVAAAAYASLSGSTTSSWMASTTDGSWTDRLGLRFKDDCQEDMGLGGLFSWAWSWITGRGGQQRSGNCESKEMRCPGGLKITGLQVRYSRIESGDRDYYDFRPRCGTQWMAYLGMRMPTRNERASHDQEEAAICSGGAAVTGVQVMRGRNDRRDQDTYTFKLRCGRQWADVPLGLAFDGLRETRSATCPGGGSLAGLRVHRGFADWGDYDTYEFQCFCAVKDGVGGGGGRGGGGGLSGHSNDDDDEPPSRSRRRPSDDKGKGGGSKRGGKPSQKGGKRGGGSSGGGSRGGRPPSSSGGGGGPFSSRRAEQDAIAEEVRRELREAQAAAAREL